MIMIGNRLSNFTVDSCETTMMMARTGPEAGCRRNTELLTTRSQEPPRRRSWCIVWYPIRRSAVGGQRSVTERRIDVHRTRDVGTFAHHPRPSPLRPRPSAVIAHDVDRHDRREAASRGHCSGSPALVSPCTTSRSCWARYVGSSLFAAQAARTREIAKDEFSARPASIAECAQGPCASSRDKPAHPAG